MTRRAVYASLPAALLAGALVVPGHAANWPDRLPAEDPGALQTRAAARPPQQLAWLPQPRPAKQTQPSKPTPPAKQTAGPADPDAAQSSTSSVAWLLNLGLAPVYGTAAAVSGLVGTVGQFTWEIGYALGIKSTPISHPALKDDVADTLAEPAADDEAVAAASTPRPAGAAPATQASTEPHAPVVPPAAAEATLATAPSPPEATRPDAGNELDRGLLANFIYDRGERRPDGSFFVPKTLQRLFNLRTTRVSFSEVPMTLKLPGQIVANPHTHGDVEASLMGRYEPPPDGLPVLGDTVVKGQILGFVVPAVGVVDRTQVRREVARLTTDIRMEAESQQILTQFSFIPFREGKIYQSQQKLAGLRRERAALLPMLQTREALRASTSGVISQTSAVSGRMIHPGDTVFEIINPAELWVEATAADPAAAADASHVLSASALTPEHQMLTLAFVGAGLALKQQATPIMFSIVQPPEGLRVGRPVTVTVNSEARLRRGLPMSRAAVTIGTDGIDEAWEQTGPETFLPHPVHVQDIDGATVLVISGLSANARIVVRGTKLLAQLQ